MDWRVATAAPTPQPSCQDAGTDAAPVGSIGELLLGCVGPISRELARRAVALTSLVLVGLCLPLVTVDSGGEQAREDSDQQFGPAVHTQS